MRIVAGRLGGRRLAAPLVVAGGAQVAGQRLTNGGQRRLAWAGPSIPGTSTIVMLHDISDGPNRLVRPVWTGVGRVAGQPVQRLLRR